MTATATEGVARWRGPRGWLAAIVLAVLLIGPTAVVRLTRSEQETGPRVERLHVAKQPTDVATSPTVAWLASASENRIVEVYDGASPYLLSSHKTGAAPLRVAADATSVWTTAAADNTVTWLDLQLADDTARHTRRVRRDAVDVAVGPDGAWITNGSRGTVTRVDPVSHGNVGPPIRTGRFPTAVAVGGLYVWVVNSGDGTLARIDPRENVVVGRRTPVGRDPQDVVVAADSVWVANRGDGTVTQVSTRSGRPLGGPLRVGGAPTALAALKDGVLVLDAAGGDVLAIDARTRAVRPIVHIGGTPSGLAVSDTGSIWVTDPRQGTVTRVLRTPQKR
jgi:DNA-binding beta-propeller fold protein YncE